MTTIVSLTDERVSGWANDCTPDSVRGRVRNSTRLISLCNFVTEWLLRRTQERRNFSARHRFVRCFAADDERKLRLLLNFIMFFFPASITCQAPERERHFGWTTRKWFFLLTSSLDSKAEAQAQPMRKPAGLPSGLSRTLLIFSEMRWNLKTLLMFSVDLLT